MNPSTVSSQFEGVSGSLIVSVVAFSIVFIVLIGLTAVIYAIKAFSGEAPKPAAPTSAAAPAAPIAPVAVASAPVSVAPSSSAKVTAAITAAVLTATQGRGRILSVVPEKPLVDWTHTWRISGRVERLGSRLVRTWKH